MKPDCDIIRDLLPLYADGVCSSSSAKAVEAHLAQCSECSMLLRKMRDNEIETGMKAEKETVIGRQAKLFKRRSAAAGAVIAGIFMIPVLVCLIVNIASGEPLGWFFIVLASLITASSLIIVPLMVPEDKAFWTYVSFTASLVLLLAVCCIYTGGRWFAVAASSSLFGLSVCFMPFAVKSRVLRRVLGRHKALAVMAADTVLFVLMMLSIGLYSRTPGFFTIASAVSVPFIVLVWLLFLLIRYPKFSGLIKAGISTAITGGFCFIADSLINALLGNLVSLPVFTPLVWNANTIDGNVKWLLLIAGCLIGAALIIGGIISEGRKRK